MTTHPDPAVDAVLSDLRERVAKATENAIRELRRLGVDDGTTSVERLRRQWEDRPGTEH
jgi:hypothetical protein